MTPTTHLVVCAEVLGFYRFPLKRHWMGCYNICILLGRYCIGIVMGKVVCDSMGPFPSSFIEVGIRNQDLGVETAK